MNEWNQAMDGPVPTPAETVEVGGGDSEQPYFLHVSGLRLILMDLLTVGIFEQYWFYRNWRYLRDRDKLDISPFWRTWLNIFFIHELFRRLREDPRLEPACADPRRPAGTRRCGS